MKTPVVGMCVCVRAHVCVMCVCVCVCACARVCVCVVQMYDVIALTLENAAEDEEISIVVFTGNVNQLRLNQC